MSTYISRCYTKGIMKKTTTKNTSSKTTLSSKTSLQLLASIIIVALAVALLFQQAHFSHYKNDQDRQLQLLSNRLEASQRTTAVVISPQDNRVYVPELRITLPYNDVTKTLRYDYNNQDGARFYSTLLQEQPGEQRISCADMVRIKHEDKPNAYSPHQPHVVTQSLAGATPLQVYALANKECTSIAWSQITPADIANQFRQAQSY